MDASSYGFYKFLFLATEEYLLSSHLNFFLWPYFVWFHFNNAFYRIYLWLTYPLTFADTVNFCFTIYYIFVFLVIGTMIPLLGLLYIIPTGIGYLAFRLTDVLWFDTTYYTIATLKKN